MLVGQTKQQATKQIKVNNWLFISKKKKHFLLNKSSTSIIFFFLWLQYLPFDLFGFRWFCTIPSIKTYIHHYYVQFPFLYEKLNINSICMSNGAQVMRLNFLFMSYVYWTKPSICYCHQRKSNLLITKKNVECVACGRLWCLEWAYASPLHYGICRVFFKMFLNVFVFNIWLLVFVLNNEFMGITWFMGDTHIGYRFGVNDFDIILWRIEHIEYLTLYSPRQY